MLRKILKYIAALSPVPLTKNEYYDRLTNQIIRRVCTPNSVCIDAGANNGKVLSMMITHCNKAIHYAFEPIPGLYHLLKRKYGSACHVYVTALSNTTGERDFIYVTSDLAYSGLIKREFDKPEKFETIKVQTGRLDDIIPNDTPIALIKMDVEGGEYDVMLGAQNLIVKWKPVILFEFGKGGSDAYNITPYKMFLLLDEHGYKVSLLRSYLKKDEALTLETFKAEYEKGNEFFFIAY